MNKVIRIELKPNDKLSINISPDLTWIEAVQALTSTIVNLSTGPNAPTDSLADKLNQVFANALSLIDPNSSFAASDLDAVVIVKIEDALIKAAAQRHITLADLIEEINGGKYDNDLKNLFINRDNPS